MGGHGFAKDDVNIEIEKLALARLVLGGLGLLFLVSSCAHVAKGQYIDATAAKEVFDFVREAFPPLVTLVLGAYFTRKSD